MNETRAQMWILVLPRARRRQGKRVILPEVLQIKALKYMDKTLHRTEKHYKFATVERENH